MTESLAAPVTDALLRVQRSSGVSLAFAGMVQNGRGVRLSRFVGPTVGALDGVAVELGHGLGGKVVTLNRPMVVDDYLRTPRITHRYNSVIAAEGLRAMAATPVVVDRAPIAVLYLAVHTDDPIGDRALDALAVESRALEQRIVASRASVAAAGADADADSLRIRLTEAYAQLRDLARSVDDEALATQITQITRTLLDDEAQATAVAVELTRREQDVLALAALGYTNARIAENLGIGVHTAKGYMKDVLRKLGAAGRLEAVVIARRAGLLP
ncbi:GAF domain-containing protein [Gordonia desulfuricans]|uniref:GAF domain-containing protein n=1 Tax=Gordonia desulfuricans TaxID=89051 RepID=A0A7K3LNC4_9ACTN|nr:LuxR C-terminal-related transcriptional regulator [Gordonia desulfuricans]NDK89746.1 GAF domain-containing protein [Gordonia desulfuricans]